MRIYIKRTKKFNTEAMLMENEIKDYLKISSLQEVYTYWGIDIEGLSEAEINDSLSLLLNEKTDILLNEPDKSSDYQFSYTSLETQYDQKSDAVKTLLKLKYPAKKINVATLNHIVLEGNVSQTEYSAIKKYFLNPLEVKEITLADSIQVVFSSETDRVITIDDFIKVESPQLAALKTEYGISMNMDDFIFCQEYFIKEQRNPTITELKILDTYWSDHCRHSTFLTTFDNIEIEESTNKESLLNAVERYKEARALVYEGKDRPDCLMDIATMQMKKMRKLGQLDDLEDSEEVNACSIEVTGLVDGKPEDFILMFKNETHNHPTEIEPYGGAATCIGGGIRDPLSGRAFVYGAMRITGAADPRESFEDTMPGKLVQRRITKTAADGYSAYANEIGLASGYLNEYYHPGFKAKRMECGGLVGYNYKKNITRENGIPGDIIVMLGGKTGRDGIGGATGSSKQQAGKAEKYSSEVQKGNPLIERNIIRLFKKPAISKIIKKCNDFGAGGVSVAIGEMANSLAIDLDKVPTKYPGLNGTEIAISESQERMAVLVSKNNLAYFVAEAEAENLIAIPVATVTDDNRVVMQFDGEVICDMSSEFLNSGGIRQHTNIRVSLAEVEQQSCSKTFGEQLLDSLGDINAASKKPIANQFNKTVGGQTTFMPYGGKYQKTPEQGLAMRLPLETGHTDLGSIMSVGYNPYLCEQNTFVGAISSVVESIMKVVSMGGSLAKTRLSFQEYFESMKTDKSWGKVYSALMGSYLVQHELNIPAIGGKDSMSGSYGDIDVPPSLLSFAVAPCDCTKLVSKAFKNTDSNVYLVSTKVNEDGTPCFASLRENITLIENLIENGKVLASSVVSSGLAVDIAQMCFGNNIGLKFSDNCTDLYNPNVYNVIIETSEVMPNLELIGKTTAVPELECNSETVLLDKALATWESPLAAIFETKLKPVITPSFLVEDKQIEPAKTKFATPKVLMPVFIGTTGEYTLARQFRRAGAEVTEVLIKTKAFNASVDEFVTQLESANIMAIPSGYSNGAQPEETAKLITYMLKLPAVKAAVNKFIANDGIIIGFGEGFNALIDTGLIENGIVGDKNSSLAMTRNASGKYYSGLVAVKYTAKNQFLDTANNMLPLNGYDCRIEVDEKDFATLCSNGQVLAVYDNNPVGSSYGIAGLASKSGKVLGFVPDLSVLEEGLYENVFKASTPQLFANIVSYFKGE